MRILLLSFYYPPDIGPGALRAKSFVDELTRQDKSVFIDVMTSMPNRYNSISIDAQEFEEDNKVSIYRFELPEHQSGMRDQALAFTTFFFNVLKLTKAQNYDLVLATSSRLFTAALGAFIAKRNNARLYLDIRDLFIDTIKDISNKGPAWVLMPLLRFLEKWTFKSANKINVVSGGFLPYVNKLQLKCNVTVYTNGIDQSFVSSEFKKDHINHNPVLLYAGNLGQGQGLDVILPIAAKTLDKNFSFIIVGDGGRRKELEKRLSSDDVKNVELLNPVPRTKLMSLYREADILFLHLNDFNAFKKVLPSKIFEYAATGKPILAGVSGFAADFLCEKVTGAFVFEPNNVEQMEKALEKLMVGPGYYDRTDFIDEFMRDTVIGKIVNEILSL
jgi:glycosyltransferase involved in cell wall biosynthesis